MNFERNECEMYSNYLTYLKKLYNLDRLELSLRKDCRYVISINDIDVNVPSYENYMVMINRDRKINEIIGTIE